jgi:endoglucanase
MFSPSRLLLLPILAFASLPAVDDFESSGPDLPAGGKWIHYQDSASSASTWTRQAAPGANGSTHCGRLAVKLSGASGWAGASGSLTAGILETDLSAYAGLRVMARTNAATLKIQIPTTATNTQYNHFAGNLKGADTTWKLFEVPFSKLKQEWGTAVAWNPATVLQVSILVMNDTKAEVWAEFDDMEFYRAGEEKVVRDTSIFVSKSPKINQVGYDPEDGKLVVATMPFHNPGDSLWVVDENRNRVWGGVFGAAIDDSASTGESVVQANFSVFRTVGTWRIEANGQISAPFSIAKGVLAGLYLDALKSFRVIRCGSEVHDERMGIHHPPCHLQDTIRSSDGTTGDFTGGWHNAGDYGKWVVEAALSVASFLWLVEFDQLRSNHSSTGREALLDEARWGLDWILKMQMPDGSVLHKVDPEPNFAWGLKPENDLQPRWASFQAKGSTEPTSVDAGVAVGVLTQGARVFASFDPDYAAKLSRAADLSWTWLAKNPRIGQQDRYYLDPDSRQEEFWARAERARLTKSDSLRKLVKSQLASIVKTEAFYHSTGIFGAMTLAFDTDSAVREAAKKRIVDLARGFASVSAATGYRIAMEPDDYGWCSNEQTLHKSQVMVAAYAVSGDSSFLRAARAQLDYVLGQNSLDTVFVYGYGTKSVQHPYHWSTYDYGRTLPGWMVPGPNHFMDATIEQLAYDHYLFDFISERNPPPAKCYLDICPKDGGYASNEGETTGIASLIFATGWFTPAASWALPQATGVAPRASRQNPSTLRIVRQGNAWILSWEGKAGRTLDIRDLSGRHEISLQLDSQSRVVWKPSRRGLFLAAPHGTQGAGTLLWVP